MMTFHKMSVPALATLLAMLTACSQANFTGNAPARADSQTPTDGGDIGTDGPADAEILCTIDPGKVAIGGKALVSLSTELNVEQLYQTVVSGESRTESTLVYGGPETRGLYTKEDGQANELVGLAEGTLTVEIRKDQSQETADATCTLNVTKDVTEPNKPIEECTDTSRKIGAELTFLIDNSNSNASTDCPNDRLIGTHNGVDLYECGSETNREKAVLTAYDVLRDVAASEPDNALARSRLAIGSFPTAGDYVNGWSNESGGFLDVVSTGRDVVAKALKFTRTPAGMTPYGAALGGATSVFASAGNDQRAKLAVLVTDGEPTDQGPESVAAKAQALKAQGVRVITVFVTAGEARESRETKHIAMLKKIDDTRLSQTNGSQHWYDPSYASFDAYIDALLGGSGQTSLIERISDRIVEVQQSADLKDAFLEIIKSEIKCER